MLGLIKWLFRYDSPQRTRERLSSRAAGRSPAPRIITVVGESFYQDAFEALAGGRTRDGHELPVTAMLIPEDGNKYDPKAVREVEGRHVGYLSRPMPAG